eukprot:GHUV01001485.1.p1 GENE.GHUV01001485.1~~GHUV01001485.1.p1  ORF type:complete len:546 (+),score=246.18 GHUV01001485.1:757-2394(+)
MDLEQKHKRLLPFRLRVPLPPIPGLGLIPGIKPARSRRVRAQQTFTTTSITTTTLTAGGATAAATAVASTAATAPVVGAPTAVSAKRAKPATKPLSDVFAGALARALSQSTIHPLDTLKVRMQAKGAAAAVAKPAAAAVPGLSKFGQLVPPPVTGPDFKAMGAGLASLYKGVFGAASGAGIAIGAYFACYGMASNIISASTDLSPSGVAFVSGGIAAAGSSVVKVPLAVCIRSVQAGVYPNVFAAASSITAKAGPRGLFTGFFPTLLEDVPDMAVKFAAYESMRQLHRQLNNGRVASPQEDFAMGAFAGALAAASTTPLDVIKTRMMCAAASSPTMSSAAREVLAASGPKGFLTGIGPRALSNGINSAVFFCFFEAIRSSLQSKAHLTAADAINAWAAQAQNRLTQVPRLITTAYDNTVMTQLRTAGAIARRIGSAFTEPTRMVNGSNHHLHWATAGAGGGLALLAGAANVRGLQVMPAGCDDADLMLAGASGLEVGAASPAMAPMSLSLLARASPLRLEDSQLVMAVQALKSVEESTNINIEDD